MQRVVISDPEKWSVELTKLDQLTFELYSFDIDDGETNVILNYVQALTLFKFLKQELGQ